jgi:SOH1
MNYLEYLEYFRSREYSKFVMYLRILAEVADFSYPTSLHILTLLKQREFRDAIMRGDIAKRLGDEIFEHFTKGAANGVNGDTTTT